MISIIVADDRALIREALRCLLAEQTDLRVIAATTAGTELAGITTRTGADVVLLRAPGSASATIAAVSRLQRAGRAAVLVIGEFPESSFGPRVVRAGAAAYLSTDCSATEMIEALRAVAARSGEDDRLDDDSPEPHPGVPGLSEREFEVLCMLGSGRNGQAVADALGLSKKTVSTYRARIMEKLQLENTAGIVRFALEHGLAD